MCGIAGFYQSDQNYLSAGYHGTSPENPWRKRLIAMRQSLRSRGPNDENTLLFHHAGLAHTRLLSLIHIFFELFSGRDKKTATAFKRRK